MLFSILANPLFSLLMSIICKEREKSLDMTIMGGGVHKLSRFDNIPEHKGRPEDTSQKNV